MSLPRQHSPSERPDGPDSAPPHQRLAPASLLTPAEAASVLHVDANTLARWSTAGKLSAVRTPGGHRRYLADEVARIRQQPDREAAGRSRSA